MPDYEKPFHLYSNETRGFTQCVLAQKHGSKLRPIAYYRTILDLVAQGFPSCLRAVAVASLAVQATESLVVGHTLILMVLHAVTAVLLKTDTTLVGLTSNDIGTINHCSNEHHDLEVPDIESR